MALSVTGVTQIFDCDTDGMVGGAGLQDTDLKAEGSGSLKIKASITTTSVLQYDQGGATGVDVTDKHFGFLGLVAGAFDTLAAGGVRIVLEDINGNNKVFYVGGIDTQNIAYKGFQCYTVWEGATAFSTSGTYDSTVHRYFGIQFKTTSKTIKENIWWDNMFMFDEIVCTSGATDAVGCEELSSWDATNAYGLFVKIAEGIYITRTGIIWGNLDTASIDFSDTKSIVQFEENLIQTSTGTTSNRHESLYKWKLQGNASGTINYVSGTKSGTSGIQGITIIDAGSANHAAIDFNNSNIDKLQIYGGQFINVGQVNFLSLTGVNYELLSTIFDDHGIITPSSFSMKYGKSISAKSDGMNISSTTFNVQYWEFISPTDSGIWTSSDLSAGVDFQSITFVGTNGTTSYDVENTHATADFLINLLGTSIVTYKNENPSTITAELNKTLKLILIDEDKDPIENVQASIHLLDSPFTALMNEDTLATGIAEQSLVYTSPKDVVVKARKSDTADNPRYLPFSDTAQITGDFTLQITLKENKFI